MERPLEVLEKSLNFTDTCLYEPCLCLFVYRLVMEELGPDDEGFAEGDSPDDDVMETNLAAEGDDELLNGPRATVYYHVPVSPTEVEEQGVDFTKEEVEEMMKSEPYQKKLATCHLYVYHHGLTG